MNEAKPAPVFNRTAHKELWQWRAEHPRLNPDAWPKWRENGGHYSSNGSYCFACYYVDELPFGHRDCSNCPLKWPHDTGCISTSGKDDNPGLYELFERFKRIDKEKAVQYALQIANLPVKEGVETC